MKQYGGRLADSGFSVIPIVPHEKRPGQLRSGSWTNYVDWSRHCDRPTKPFEIDVWSRWGGCGIGIACGRVAAVDIDVADPEYAFKIEALAFEKFGRTPAIRIGQNPKRLLVYRTKEPFKKVFSGPIEVLCHGQQFVAFGVHPDTGEPYMWPEESLADIDIEELPEIDHAGARNFVIQAQKLLPVELRGSRLGPDLVSEQSKYKDLEGTPEAVEEALKYIPNDDLHYDYWIRIGLAIKGAIGEDGEDLWLNWSAKSSKDNPDYSIKQWQSFKPKLIGAGTLYKYANDLGWIPPDDMILNGSDAKAFHAANGAELAKQILDGMTGKNKENGIHLPVELIENTPEPITHKVNGINGFHANGHAEPIDPKCPHLDGCTGAVKQMVDWIVQTSFRPQPFLALGATLAALGTVMGRRYRTPTDLRSNLYVVGIANSSSGKEHARRCVRDLFVDAQLLNYLGGERIASGPAITSALIRHPALLFQLDEFGHMVKAVLAPGRPQKHVVEIWQNLTQLSTSASSTFGGTEYAVHPSSDEAKSDGHKGPEIVVNPHVCINATSTPGQFWEALTDGAINDGGFARYLMFISPEQYPEAEMNPYEPPPQSLIEAVQVMAAGESTLGGLMHHKVKADPRLVSYGPGVEIFIRDLLRKQTAKLREDENSAMNSVIGRSVENAIKVALIAAVGDDPKTPLIEMRHIRWASDLVDYCIATAIEDAASKMHETQHKTNQDLVLDAVRRAGEKGLSKNVLTQKTRYKMTPRARKEALEDLIEARAIVVEEKPGEGRGRPAQVYHAMI